MPELFPLGLLALACVAALHEPLACAHAAPSPARSAHGTPRVTAAGNSVTPLESPPGPAFAALAARGPRVAPGMHEVARMQNSGDKVEIAHAEGRDACVRVAFEASSPVVAKLVDAQGNVLASSDTPATDGVLGQRGPVCVRRGDSVSALAEGSGASVRWMAWASP